MASRWNWKVNPNNPKPVDQESDLLMGLVLSPGTDLLRNCDLPPPLKLFSHRAELLRALSLSQTRAREAETKRAEIAKDNDALFAAFTEDAMKLFGYRQLLKLMDFEIVSLRSEVCRRLSGGELVHHGKEDGGGGGFPWIVAAAFCLGMFGAGLVFGCRLFS